MTGNSLQSYPTCLAYKDDSAISCVTYAYIKTYDYCLKSAVFACPDLSACLTIDIANKSEPKTKTEINPLCFL